MSAKKDMNCGETRKSTRKGKKIMKKVCKDGKEKLVHAGAKGYKNNYSKEAKSSFRARHSCDEKKSWDSAQKVACEELWGKSQKIGKKGYEDGGVISCEDGCSCGNCKRKKTLKLLM